MAAARVLCEGTVRLPPLPTIRDLVKMYQLTAIKQLSQNFLMDERLTDKIVRAAGNMHGHFVVEVGPGPGGITRSIIRRSPKHLVVVEKDRRFIPTLELLAEATRDQMQLDIVRGDILRYPITTLFAQCPKTEWTDKRAPVHLLGNLPFAISTRLLVNWLNDISKREGAWSFGRASMTLTFQQEVAVRIVAPLLSRERCRLSVMSQIWTRPELRFTIPGRAFVPKPDVDVGVVTLVPLKQPLTDVRFEIVEKLVRHLFSMRQKYVQRGIENLFPPDIRDELTERMFRTADVDPMARSFELSNVECCRLAATYRDILDERPDIAAFNYRACKKPEKMQA